MRYIIFIALFLMSVNGFAQSNPSGIPTQLSTGWFRHGWDQSDSGLILANRIPNFTPRFPGTTILYQHAGVDSNMNFWNGSRWVDLIPGFDSTSLSNRINLKLNITDTTFKWWGIGKRWVDTVYRKNDSTIGFTINNGAEQTFQILGRSSGGGGGSGTVTSVALSMPSAFSVSGSPITTSGTFNVSVAGTTAQYIRGNGTLATTDTGMIPNFYLKVRSLFSGTSPITYNSITGAIHIPDANNTGTKGAATFNNSDFTDDGAGLISLRNPPGGPAVDTIFRTPGIDSIYYTINGVQRAIKDSVGSGGGSGITQLTGDVTAGPGSGSQAATISNNAVTNAKFRQSAALSVVGNSTNGTANVADISASADGNILRRSSTSIGFGSIDLASSNAVGSSILPIANGGTGTATPSLVAGTNVTITGSWPNQTVNATGGGATFPDGLLASTSNTPRVAKDSDVVNTMNQYLLLHNPFRAGKTDSVYFFGDSYTAGSGASQTQFRWTSLFAFRMGCVEVNYGVAGGTLEKRVPVDYQSAPNMIDLLPLVPVKAFNRKMLVFAYGLNDMGQTAPAYNTTNYKTDYDSVIHYCVNKGWQPNEILIIPPYWIGYAGYQVYATITGNAAPTVQRHTDFVFATQQTATKWGTMYFDIFNDQLRNDTTLISSVDHIHPTDAGYEYIEWDISKYITPSMNILVGTGSPSSISNPMAINTGAAFSNSTGDPSKIKICTYCDGTATNNFGIGVSSQNFEFHAGGSGTNYSWFVNGNSAPVMKLGQGGTGALRLQLDQNASSVGSAFPTYLSLGGTYSTTAGDTVDPKLRVYDVLTGGTFGLTLSSQAPGTGQAEFVAPWNCPYDFYIGPALVSRINRTNFLIPNLKIRAAADSVGTATGGYVFRDAATGDFKITQAGGGGNTIYTGDGTLAAERTVSSGGFTLRINGANNSDTLVSVTNTGTNGIGLFSSGTLMGANVNSTNLGLFVFGTAQGMQTKSTNGEGIFAQSDAIRAGKFVTNLSATNTVGEVLNLQRAVNGDVGANGVGAAITFSAENTLGSQVTTAQFIGKFTDATSGAEVSQISLVGVNNSATNTVLTIDGDGSFTTFGRRIMNVSVSSAGTLTLGSSEGYIFSGTTTTWTLPAVSGNTGVIYYIKNRGSGNITLNSNAGGNDIYDTSATNTLTISAGTARILVNDGTYYTVQ